MVHVFVHDGQGWRYRIIRQQRSADGRALVVTYAVAGN
jgi:hypothetical protein